MECHSSGLKSSLSSKGDWILEKLLQQARKAAQEAEDKNKPKEKGKKGDSKKTDDKPKADAEEGQVVEE